MLSRLFGKPKAPPYLALAEYWVYLPEAKAPLQDDIMSRMIQSSPYRQGKDPIGTREGLIWSDVRLHMALALRDKNIHIFRPDLLESHVEPSAAQLDALSSAKALFKLRYASDQPLPDKRHLQFLVHAAEAAGELGGSSLVFDLIGERLFEFGALQELLKEDNDGTRKDLHLQVFWRSSPNGGTAETRGLRKVGLPELFTPETMGDHQVLALHVLEAAADLLWETPVLPERVEVEHFGDLFHVIFEPSRKGPCQVRIMRESR